MYTKFFKRFIDLFFSLLAFPFFLLILIFIGPAIYFNDRGPVFYNALRMGKDGKDFKMYKFRSMKINAPDIRNADGSTFNSNSDSRVTNVGKFLRKTSIDEIPQLLNVIKGDMSLVGPRPNLPASKERIQSFSPDHRKRMEVAPGITGFTQAFYRNSIPSVKKFEYDAYYVEHVSFLLDCKIILQTIKSVVKNENIYMDSKLNDNAG